MEGSFSCGRELNKQNYNKNCQNKCNYRNNVQNWGGNNMNVIEHNFSEYWKELREQKQFCDAIIKLPSGNTFKVHRIILSACSQYFKAIFMYNSGVNTPLSRKRILKSKISYKGSNLDQQTAKFLENYNEMVEVSLDLSDTIMETILDYAYTGICNINWSNVEDLLASSDHCQIIGTLKLCCKFLYEQLNYENCIGIHLFAGIYFCIELENYAKIFILKNFTNVMRKSYEFQQLGGDELRNFLNDDYLNVKNELIVFDAIKNWIEYNPDKRLKWIKELLPCIRIGLISNKQLRKNIINWKYICESMDIQKLILPLQYKPRIPHKIIMVIGGWFNGGPSDIIEVYDTRADVWLEIPYSDTIRAYHGVCTLNQKVYVIGGFNGFNYYNSMRCFDPIEYKWEEKACMNEPRCYVSIAVLDGKIYALGGYNGYTRLNSVERYDPNKNQWEILSPMCKHRSDAAAATLGNSIYIVGGFNGDEILNSCEMYNKEHDLWTIISYMLSPRSGVGLVAFNDYIYAIGGFSGNSRLNSVERYCVKNSRWYEIDSMMLPRSNFATAFIDGIIYAIGGYNGSTPISFVEQYDPSLNTWKAATQMNYRRSAPGACVLQNLPNIKSYSLHSFDMISNNSCLLKCNSIANRQRLRELGIEYEKIANNFHQGEKNMLLNNQNNGEIINNNNNNNITSFSETIVDNNN